MTKGRPVRIGIVFEPGLPPRPVWFELDRRKHSVREITYRWSARCGERTLQHCAVSDGEALFELVYDPLDQTWRLCDQRAVP